MKTKKKLMKSIRKPIPKPTKIEKSNKPKLLDKIRKDESQCNHGDWIRAIYTNNQYCAYCGCCR